MPHEPEGEGELLAPHQVWGDQLLSTHNLNVIIHWCGSGYWPQVYHVCMDPQAEWGVHVAGAHWVLVAPHWPARIAPSLLHHVVAGVGGLVTDNVPPSDTVLATFLFPLSVTFVSFALITILTAALIRTYTAVCTEVHTPHVVETLVQYPEDARHDG